MAFINIANRIFNTNHIAWVTEPKEMVEGSSAYVIEIKMSYGETTTLGPMSSLDKARAMYTEIDSLILGRKKG